MNYRSRPSAGAILATSSDHVHAVSLDNGLTIWTVKVKGTGSRPTVLAYGADVYAAGNGAEVYRIDKVSGHVVWTATTESRGKAQLHVEGGRLIMMRRRWLEVWDRATGQRLLSTLTGIGGTVLQLVDGAAPPCLELDG